ncbi:MAG: hypothetical protein CYPHOPRED_001621 [Cyphobasidiales sp. Tagirdzhanova-0007]|nr:MAG: hypothetical protein CYPHOPRED_001621 [Cyphobasidiales sp. Tagirdzhanova-0007]
MLLPSLSFSLLLLASSTSAGLLDRFVNTLRTPTSVDAAASPAPPAEPSLDAFGGSAPGSNNPRVVADPVQAGAPSVASGQGAVKTSLAESSSVPSATPEAPYEGIEWRWKIIRVRPGELYYEGFALAGVIVFIGISLLGKQANKDQAIAWWKAHVDILRDNFSSFSSNPPSVSLTRSDPSIYYGYATGRRGTTGLTTTISTYPRHDFAQLLNILVQKLYDLTWVSVTNQVHLEFVLDGSEKSDFIFAICRKNDMMQFKSERWDVASFAPVAERLSDLGEEFVVFSEGGLLSDWWLKRQNVGIRDLFRSESAEAKRALQYLHSIVFSDIVATRPEESTLEKTGSIPKSRKMTMIMTLPSTEKAAETRPLVELALNLIDVFSGSSVPGEVITKTKKRRIEIYNLLLSESRKEATEKKTSEARAIKKRADEEKKEKMTLAERRKIEAKEKDKQMRKAAGKSQRK